MNDQERIEAAMSRMPKVPNPYKIEMCEWPAWEEAAYQQRRVLAEDGWVKKTREEIADFVVEISSKLTGGVGDFLNPLEMKILDEELYRWLQGDVDAGTKENSRLE